MPKGGRGGEDRRRKNFEEVRKRDIKRAQINEEKRRVSLKLASWNVNRFAMRTANVESLIAHEQVDVLFVCETLQRRWKSRIVPPINFEGIIISMPAHKPRRSGRPNMGIAFLFKWRGLLRKQSTFEGKYWQMLEVRHANLKVVAYKPTTSKLLVYMHPPAHQHKARNWMDINASLKRLRAK